MNERIDRESWQPVRVEVNALADKNATFVIDQYADQLEEVFLLRNPRYRFNKDYKAALAAFEEDHFAGKPADEAGNWFYYPWSGTLVHFLPEAMHYEVRTGRNRYLIDKEEQERYYRATVGVLGMSVGSHAALALVLTGGARHLKLADPDIISASNTNRIRTGFQNIGLSKVKAVARQVYEIDPYVEIEIHADGATEENLHDFIASPKLDILIEETDLPFIKLRAREYARETGVPVIMAADNGDGNTVDVERYDLDRTLPLLHGILGDMTAEHVRQVSPKDLPGIIARMAGADRAVPRMLASVPEVGKTIYSWPQLGTAANLCGTTLAYLARRIILGAPNIVSGRFEVSMDAVFESDYAATAATRKKAFDDFLQKMQGGPSDGVK